MVQERYGYIAYTLQYKKDPTFIFFGVMWHTNTFIFLVLLFRPIGFKGRKKKTKEMENDQKADSNFHKSYQIKISN